jgi:hypothetical protein
MKLTSQMPSPGDPQAEPTIGNPINGGFDLLETKCNRSPRSSSDYNHSQPNHAGGAGMSWPMSIRGQRQLKRRARPDVAGS